MLPLSKKICLKILIRLMRLLYCECDIWIHGYCKLLSHRHPLFICTCCQKRTSVVIRIIRKKKLFKSMYYIHKWLCSALWNLTWSDKYKLLIKLNDVFQFTFCSSHPKKSTNAPSRSRLIRRASSAPREWRHDIPNACPTLAKPLSHCIKASFLNSLFYVPVIWALSCVGSSPLSMVACSWFTFLFIPAVNL